MKTIIWRSEIALWNIHYVCPYFHCVKITSFTRTAVVWTFTFYIYLFILSPPVGLTAFPHPCYAGGDVAVNTEHLLPLLPHPLLLSYFRVQGHNTV
jgi:hypothetical protein